MKSISRKVYSKITDKGITRDNILEIIDSTNPHELKKSFQDDCLFQSDKYFAKTIIDELLRYQIIRKEGNRYYKIEPQKKEEKKSVKD